MWRSPLIHRRKTLARVALYGLAVVLPATAWLTARHLSRPMVLDVSWDLPPEEYEAMEPVSLLQAYLRLDTSAPDGSEVVGAEWLAAQLDAAGIEAHLERVGSRHANLWAILEGDDPRALVLHNHIDVEPVVHPEAWKHPPFAGTVDPPWIFGRGAFDMKSVTIAQLLAFLELHRSGVPLARSVMFLATGDEETGSRFGIRYFLARHPELEARMWAVLTEGGVVEAIDRDNIKYWGTENDQKRFVSIVACHRSRERLEALVEDLRTLDPGRFTRRIPVEIDRFLARYAPTRESSTIRARLTERERLRVDASLMELPEYLQLMVRNDVFATEVTPDPEGGYRVEIVLALLAGITVEQARAELAPAWITHGVAVTVDEAHPPVAASSTDHPAFAILDRFMNRELEGIGDGNGVHGPFPVPKSATDARFFRAAGVPAYGFSPFVIMSTDTFQMKSANERIALPPYLEGVNRYVRLVRALTARDP